MSCRYKEECPSCTGWCEGPKQDFSQCIPFLITSREHWKHEAQKQAACAGEFRIAFAERLELIRNSICTTRKQMTAENDADTYIRLQVKYQQLLSQESWLEDVLAGKRCVADG